MDRTNQLDFSAFLQDAVNLLRRNMDAYPAFDSSRPYDEKNQYFLELAGMGEALLLRTRNFSAGEIFFSALKNEILEYERTNHKIFNKGMVYADLGIAQIASMKLDPGVAHLLAADKEDQPFVHDPHGILNSELWRQFERPVIFDYLTGFNTDPNAGLNFQVDEAFLEGFFTHLDLQDSLFLEATIWALRDNLSLNAMHPNTYTQGRLYSGIKDLCLLTESLLRKHQIAQGLVNANQQIMLGNLLASALANKNINYPQQNLRFWANNLQDFVNNLEDILSNANSPELRRIHCLYLIRNFTGHHFDLTDTTVSANGRSFFDMYSVAHVNVLAAILYLFHIGEI
jgi:hypothetical protein